MPPVGAERWFHTLVVVGASLAGCGGATTDKGTPAASGNGGTLSTGGALSTGPTLLLGGASSAGTPNGGVGSTALTGPSGCVYAAQYVCDDYETRTNCRCDITAPHQKSDCQSPLDYQCIALPCRVPPSAACFGDEYVGCRCDPSGPRPSDCATPEQFFCNIERPVFSHCGCVPDPAPSPTSCSGSRFYCCQSDDPQFGCGCECVGIK
jgi:hypothetical protein